MRHLTTPPNIKPVHNLSDLLTVDVGFSHVTNCISYDRALPEQDFDMLGEQFWGWCRMTYPVRDRHKPAEHPDGVYIDGVLGYRLKSLKPLFAFASAISPRLPSQQSESVRHVLKACHTIKDDFNTLVLNGFRPEVRFVREYLPQKYADVNDFHIDHMGWEFGRIVGCYNTPTTEWITNDDAIILDPQTLEVEAKPEATIHSFKAGTITRTATRFTKGSPPFIHRGPKSPDKVRVLITGHRLQDEPVKRWKNEKPPELMQ